MDKLLDKVMKVILSCHTEEQLLVAVMYSDLAYRSISNEIGGIDRTKFIGLVDRSIGFAQCRVKYGSRGNT